MFMRFTEKGFSTGKLDVAFRGGGERLGKGVKICLLRLFLLLSFIRKEIQILGCFAIREPEEDPDLSASTLD